MNFSTEPRTEFFKTLDMLLKNQGQHYIGNFARDIFARVSWEDIAPHTPESMLVIVQNAWANVQKERKSQPNVRIYEPEWHDKPISILEIISTNRPFIFDSISGELAERGLNIHLVAHPILSLKRNSDGICETYLGLEPVAGEQIVRESFIHIHLDPFTEDSEKQELIDALLLVLSDVKHAVEDWRMMQTRVAEIIAQFKSNPPAIEIDEMNEAIAFLDWLYDNNFTFLGIREYEFIGGETNGSLEPIESTGLGLLRDPSVGILRRGTKPVTMTPIIRAFLKAKTPLIVSKGNLRSRVHRRAYMDYVGIKLFDKNGELTGELRITGLFTSTAYTRSAFTIPYIRRKVEHVLQHAGFDHDSHSGKALVSVLENFPRDELFQIDNESLYEFAMAVLELEERPRIRVLARRDEFERFVSVLVYIPRERVVTDIRLRIGDTIAKAFGGRISAFTPSYPEGPLARLQFIIGKNVDTVLYPERVELELEIAMIVQSWKERLALSIQTESGNNTRFAKSITQIWGNAFDGAYQQDFDVQTARADIKSIEKMNGDRAISLDLFKNINGDNTRYDLKIFHKNIPIPLSERVPILENMGFRVIAERTYTIHPIYKDAKPDTIYLHNIELTLSNSLDLHKEFNFINAEALFHAVWEGRVENDVFNALGLHADFDWRQIMLMRAIGRYLRQVDATHTLFYMAQTLNRHAKIVKHIFELFSTKFEPFHCRDMQTRQKSIDAIKAILVRALSAVDSLDEDKILRRFINVIDASVRTNFYQNLESNTVSLKINSSIIDSMPKPVPMAEIWVYSPRVEGVHLRFGRFARGGLRWSDRSQDFRTEVLGLVKAQQVKNAVIVPVGAKGGFVPKQLPVGGNREDVFKEGTEAYKIFVGNLLDISDNRAVNGEAIPPIKVVRHDQDDSYLVVAADKGTATFSDIANELSLARNFWLGDAFASGGSVGYDHKKMAITARGAWEAVKRHFRECNINIQTTSFTVAGVGDMSGDVFGNGMLLSPCIQLIAAFDHRDIFLDPTPDIHTSFNERLRIFQLPRSSWADYNPDVISKGGGVFSRSLKSISLSPEVKKALGISVDTLTPDGLITAILKSDVDLLWFGGIGTYIRASLETDSQVGDRANDGIRISALDVRAKVVGEGANLGVTQLSRIEMAQNGVRLNTDAIDNSAGVNSSDMEVNIKIALEGIVRSNRLTISERNQLLARMTDDVARLVLMNNYRQTLAVSVAEHAGVEDLAFVERLMERLESEGKLDRSVEFLPSSAEITRRVATGKGLTRPEISVLLAYAKLSLKANLLVSSHLDNPTFEPLLLSYFPQELQATYKDDLLKHGLRREIITTKLVNLLVDQGGVSLLPRLLDQSGASVTTLAIAFSVAWQIFDGDKRLEYIDSLDANANGHEQILLYTNLQNFMRAQTLWLIRNEQVEHNLELILDTYKNGLKLIHHGTLLPLNELENALEIIRIQQRSNAQMTDIMNAWNSVGAAFMLPDLLEKAAQLQFDAYFDTLAQARIINDIKRTQHIITRTVLEKGGFEVWKRSQNDAVNRVVNAVHKELKGEQMTLSRLAVLGGFIADLSAV